MKAAGLGGLLARRREAKQWLQATARNLELFKKRLVQLDAGRHQLAKQALKAERFGKPKAERPRLEGLRLLACHQRVSAAHEAAWMQAAEVEPGLHISPAGEPNCSPPQPPSTKTEPARGAAAGYRLRELAEQRVALGGGSREAEGLGAALETLAARVAGLEENIASADARLAELDAAQLHLAAAFEQEAADFAAAEVARRTALDERRGLKQRLCEPRATVERSKKSEASSDGSSRASQSAA